MNLFYEVQFMFRSDFHHAWLDVRYVKRSKKATKFLRSILVSSFKLLRNILYSIQRFETSFVNENGAYKSKETRLT